MRQVRRGVFETNSSSTHSLTMCNGDDFDKWKNGELYYCEDAWRSESEYTSLDFVTMEQLVDILAKNKYYDGPDPTKLSKEDLNKTLKDRDMQIYTYTNYGSGYLEYFENSYTTPNGEKVVAFGQFGYDG